MGLIVTLKIVGIISIMLLAVYFIFRQLDKVKF